MTEKDLEYIILQLILFTVLIYSILIVNNEVYENCKYPIISPPEQVIPFGRIVPD